MYAGIEPTECEIVHHSIELIGLERGIRNGSAVKHGAPEHDVGIRSLAASREDILDDHTIAMISQGDSGGERDHVTGQGFRSAGSLLDVRVIRR